MEIVPLTGATPPKVVESMGELYKVMAPAHTTSAEEIGRTMQRSVKKSSRKYRQLGISERLPYRYLMAVDDQTVVGYGLIQFRVGEEGNIQQSCYSHIFVHPEKRNQGIGTQLLNNLLSQMNDSAIASIFFFAEDDTAEEFLTNRGGEITEYTIQQQLHLDLQTHIEHKIPDHVSIKIMTDPSVDQLQEFMEVYHISKQDEPRGNDREYEPMSAKDWLDFASANAEEVFAATLAVDDKVVAVTDMMRTTVENKLFQRFTGVLPEFRRQGWGKLLKIEILCYLQRKRKELFPLIVETSTLRQNTAMRKLNNSIGYRDVGKEVTVEFYSEE